MSRASDFNLVTSVHRGRRYVEEGGLDVARRHALCGESGGRGEENTCKGE